MLEKHCQPLARTARPTDVGRNKTAQAVAQGGRFQQPERRKHQSCA
ncbi:MAG: hypothetical protein ACXWFD_19235 [Methylobacter sp.]